MAEKDQFGAWSHACPDRFDDLFGGGEREWDRLADYFCPCVLANELEGTVTGSVFVVCGENFVASGKGEGAGDDVDTCGGVGDIGNIIGRNPNIFPQPLTRNAHVVSVFALTAEKENGLLF